jgi:hypothetical protein
MVLTDFSQADTREDSQRERRGGNDLVVMLQPPRNFVANRGRCSGRKTNPEALSSRGYLQV